MNQGQNPECPQAVVPAKAKKPNPEELGLEGWQTLAALLPCHGSPQPLRCQRGEEIRGEPTKCLKSGNAWVTKKGW